MPMTKFFHKIHLQKKVKDAAEQFRNSGILSENPALDSPSQQENDAIPQPRLLLLLLLLLLLWSIPAGFHVELIGDPAQVAANQFPIRNTFFIFFRLLLLLLLLLLF